MSNIELTIYDDIITMIKDNLQLLILNDGVKIYRNA